MIQLKIYFVKETVGFNLKYISYTSIQNIFCKKREAAYFVFSRKGGAFLGTELSIVKGSVAE